MKGRHWFVVGIVAFLLLMFAIECRLPKRFVWRPTFGHYDEQPFGCALFDSLVSVSASKRILCPVRRFISWLLKIH